MKYKNSMYNIKFKYKNIIYIFNSFTGALCSFTEQEYDNIFVRNKYDLNTLEQLYNHGLLVDSNIDEFNRARLRNRLAKYNNSSKVLNIVLAPTSMCNLHCKYCFQNKNKKNNLNEIYRIEKDIIEFIIKIINKYNFKKLKIQWFGGEPLLSFQFIKSFTKKIQSFCKQNDVVYYSSMITNGTLLDDNKINELISLGIKKLQITMDGTESTYCKYKQANVKQYYTLLRSLKQIPNDITISLRLNCDKQNYNEIKELCNTGLKDIIQKPNVNVYLGRIEYDYNDKNISYCFSVDEFNEIKYDFSQFLKSLKINNLNINLKKNYYCGFSSLFCFGIDDKGFLYNCEREIGDIDKSIGTIWSGINYNEKYLNFLSSETPYEDCKICRFYPLCYGGCPKHFDNGIKDCQITEKIIFDNLISFLSHGN